MNATQTVGAIVLFFAWLVPNHYPPWTSFHNESTAFVGLFLVAAGSVGNGRKLCAPFAAWAVGLAATIPWLQTAAGQLQFTGDAWVSSLYLLGLAAAICVGFTSAKADARKFSALLAGASLAAALGSSAVAVAQCFGLRGDIWLAEIPFGSRGVGNVAQPNNLATLIALGTTGLWLLYERRRVSGALAVAGLVILLVGITMSQSRTALVFGPVLMLLRATTGRRTLAWRLKKRSLTIAVAFEWLLAFTWPSAREFLGLAALESLSQINLQTGRRLVWPILLDGALQHPWIGYGWLQTGAAQLSVAESHPQIDELFLQSHNVFLDLILWCGLPLGLLLSASIVMWLVRRFRDAKNTQAAIALSGIALFGVHAMLEFPHHYAYFLLPVGLWAGFIEASRGARPIGPLRVLHSTLIGTAVLAVAVAWSYPAVEEDFRLMRFENLSIGSLRASRPAPDATFLSSLTAYLRFMRTPLVADMGPNALAAMNAVVQRYPYSTALYRYAKALALNGQLFDALLTMKKLRNIHGEPRYQALKILLWQEIAEGQPNLGAFAAAIPP